MTSSSEHEAPDLIAHFEYTLGLIQRGWSVDPDRVKMPFQIVQFASGSDEDSVGYATLGLSRHLLESAASDRTIRQELLMLAPKKMKPDFPVGLLHQLGSMVLGTHKALLRGNVIGPANALVPGSELTALYVASPVYFPDEFATFTDDDGDVVVAWLVPISTGEADFVWHHGWGAFEDLLLEQDPDLVDFDRPEMKLWPVR
ncbi:MULTISPECIES: suppressor of fused domain protein [Arthrobacter]|uniref:Suppressor of fused domain protein n=2 Tax=Arthrobacter TaxID=1663 RepID=A0ABU9KP98_9MICC|nr:suppressor of fused domain protein [Arthrobacter sp. YJM1]MDP5228743.1 suppressor of fused domain protein [Arthrobacter sp. YJM1]